MGASMCLRDIGQMSKAKPIQGTGFLRAGISTGMDDRFNTIAGWVLAAGIAALGFTLLSGEYFRHHHVEKGGYHVEEAETGGGGTGAVADLPIGQLMAAADPAKGAEVFKKCSSCHTIAAGGANGTGPNLYGIVGKPVGKHAAGFAYSSDLSGHGGNWDWNNLNAWLKKPKAFAEGTKMSFAGLSKAADRADLLAYLNSQGSNAPLPPVEAAAAAAPAAGAAPADAAKAAAPAAEPVPAK
jgi:cytochrome c